MPGVVVHAQMVSQIISVASGQMSLLSVWPDWAELLWIGGWATVGGSLVWVVRQPARLATAAAGATGLLLGGTYALFVGFIWLPSVTPAIALWLSGAAIMSWRAYKT